MFNNDTFFKEKNFEKLNTETKPKKRTVRKDNNSCCKKRFYGSRKRKLFTLYDY